MLVNEQHVMLETRVQVRLQPEMHNDGVMVAVDMRVDAVETFEDLSDERRECFGEGDTYKNHVPFSKDC